MRATPDGPVLAQIDRGAIPSFGVVAAGVHLNGLVRRADGLHVWIARRAADKLLDPGKLDHITAGGVPAGLTPEQTLVKEAEEEAAIPAALASRPAASPRSAMRWSVPRACGAICCTATTSTCPRISSRVPRTARWRLRVVAGRARCSQTVRDTDEFKFNVNLVLIDLFLREGLIPGHEADCLRQALDAA